jgi:diadenosine tetraphosphate (Ap4A) HIT family hydrolase
MPEGCLACDLAEGRQYLPGGLIVQIDEWRVEHCVGPFGPGTLILKPQRHVEGLAALTPHEASSLGQALRLTADVVQRVTSAAQVYACLWSHGPVHIHFVVQPETDRVIAEFGRWGPVLQAEMVTKGCNPSIEEIEEITARARQAFDVLTRETSGQQILQR